ncbi:MAG: hypothetical protein ABIX11_04460 [Casimicrobiaceae bacterium]
MSAIARGWLRAAAWAAALAALAPSSAVQAQGADDLYEVTVKMEMAGMPVQMEGQDMEMTQSIAGRRVGGCTAR